MIKSVSLTRSAFTIFENKIYGKQLSRVYGMQIRRLFMARKCTYVILLLGCLWRPCMRSLDQCTVRIYRRLLFDSFQGRTGTIRASGSAAKPSVGTRHAAGPAVELASELE